MVISDKIKQIRQHHYLTQESFAEDIGISRTNLINIEKGRVNPTLTVIKYISLAYNVDINWLLDDTALQTEDIPNSNNSSTIDDIILYYNVSVNSNTPTKNTPLLVYFY